MVNIRKISYDDIISSTIYEKNSAIELVLKEDSSHKKSENKVLVELPKEVLTKFSSNINEKLKSTTTNKGYSSFFKNPVINTVSQILLGASPIILFFLMLYNILIVNYSYHPSIFLFGTIPFKTIFLNNTTFIVIKLNKKYE